MYEGQTFEAILERMLNRVPSNVDKRPGSIIYDALAPAAAELAQLYMELDTNINLSYADTATGEYLERRTGEFGINREQATKARRKGLFYASGDVPIDVPVGSRFSINDLDYTAISKISTGQWMLECETPGVIGNQEFGPLLPIDYIDGLVRAELADVLVPGEDAETDDSLRQRYMDAINEQPFGGNVSDYKQKINAIPGVGGTKIFPVWNGGGTVKATIIAANFGPTSQILIDEVQTLIDPEVNSGLGIGLAPIGHKVTVTGAQAQVINVTATLTLAPDTTIGQVQQDVEDALSAYLLSIRQAWANESALIVRVAQVESRILTVPGVVDVANTQLNGSATNVVLTDEQIPVFGTVTLSE
ncbi:baseplate J/gp47 family protein [Paenibacillus vini]|uniref:baseplate J/gp47 family protein n=1 Tax=Paenibacillus vini TaxID=1476024 RepID=UPI0025B64D25|nr:baseplate J/gp47 family protein [Paenibacillus vini]MDN4069274.1 baseplate J/gp47 family protein [Paenibacillus vini]MDN4069327.1 baseplate J/gp47 family protein [Paenibacillus vini]